MTLWCEIKTIVVILAMLLLPGWALLSLGKYRERWQPLQRWFLALCLGIAVYPVIFYAARVVFPGLLIGTNKLLLFLALCALMIILRLRKDWKAQFSLGRHAGFILFILLLTLGTRLYLAHMYPYPAWTDSVHHSIITKLVMQSGQLPTTMLPYDPGSLSGYHLGLYSLTGPLGLLTGIPPHSSLIWFCQFVNGLAGLGVFLVLDRKVSRVAGLAGLVFAGLLSFQPAWYFNWGRDTQLVAQSILLPAGLAFWDLLEHANKSAEEPRCNRYIGILLTSILVAGCSMIHFRVAAFLLPLLLLVAAISLARKCIFPKQRLKLTGTILIVGFVSIVMILPAFIPAITDYLNPIPRNPTSAKLPTAPRNLSEDTFYRFTYKQFESLGLTKVLTGLALGGLITGLFFQKTRSLALLIILWVLLLIAEGYLYLFNIRKLAFINMTGIMIAAYLPGALGFGLLVHHLANLLTHLPGFQTPNVLMIVLCLAGLIYAPDRINGVESYRFYMTPDDEKAMNWIRTHIPADGVIGINTAYWTQTAFIGTDAGFWLPYFAERETSTRTMMSYRAVDFTNVRLRTMSIMKLYENPNELTDLCELGIDYLYSASNPPYNKQDFNVESLILQPGVSLLYNQGGVQVLHICSGGNLP
ncbi:MAG: hypothetical protein ACOYKD_08905 [Anaerolineaceae bacterium]|jgi:hypothetical protein